MELRVLVSRPAGCDVNTPEVLWQQYPPFAHADLLGDWLQPSPPFWSWFIVSILSLSAL